MKSHTEFQQFVVDIKLINLEISVVFFLLPNNEQCCKIIRAVKILSHG